MDNGSLGDGSGPVLFGPWSQPGSERGDQAPLLVEDRLEPTNFSPEELKLLQLLLGVHGPQTQLVQLFTRGVDQPTAARINPGSPARAETGDPAPSSGASGESDADHRRSFR